MNFQEFRRILTATLLVPLTLLLLLAIVLAWQIKRTFEEQRRIDHSDRITSQLNEVQRLIFAEDIHHDHPSSKDLIPGASHGTLTTQLRSVFDGLTKLFENDPEQSLRLRQARDSHALWLSFFDQATPALTNSPATESPSNEAERQAVDDLLTRVRDMVQVEAARRHQEVRATSGRVRSLMIILLICSIGMGFALGIFTQRNLKKVFNAYRNSLDEERRRADELFQSRQWLQTTLESVADALITCNDRGRIEFMNPIAQRLTGCDLSEGRGRSLSEVLHVIDLESRGPVNDPGRLAMKQHATYHSMSPSVLVSRDGSECEIEYSAAPICGAGEEVTGVVLVFRDVTARRQAETALLANEKLAVAGRLTASIAHEIHNPLDAVANLHYLIEHENNPAQQRRYLAMAQVELARTLQISRAMLGLYREPKAPVQVNLRELLESVLLLLDRRLKDQSITVEQALDKAATVKGFPGELRQVFTNLITNAAEAAGPGGRIRVHLESASTVNGSNGAAVVITDSGAGIPQGLETKLCQPFFTTKGEQGTGLGLWVSRGIVEKHDGTIELTNAKEGELRGALVRVYLPTI